MNATIAGAKDTKNKNLFGLRSWHPSSILIVEDLNFFPESSAQAEPFVSSSDFYSSHCKQQLSCRSFRESAR
jgi:hypothetical protein